MDDVLNRIVKLNQVHEILEQEDGKEPVDEELDNVDREDRPVQHVE